LETPCFLTVRVRVSGGAALNDRRKMFEDCHRKDTKQRYSSELTVARLDHEAQWIGLCCNQRGNAARYILASLCLCAVPWRLLFTSHAAYLHLVILKKLVFDLPVPPGFRMAPPMPKSRINKVNQNQSEIGNNVKSPNDADATFLPNVYVCDFGIHWLRNRFVALGLFCCALCCAVCVLSCMSEHSRGLKFAAIVFAALLAYFEGIYLTSFAHRSLGWSTEGARRGGLLAGAIVAVAAIVMACNSFWLSVSWDSWQHRGPTCVQELAGVPRGTSWAIYLSDGFVDETQVKSSHIMCHNNKHHFKKPCQFVFASPIYENAAAVLHNFSAPVAWAVASGVRPHQVLCNDQGGICGFDAARIFSQGELDRFRHLIGVQSDPPLVVIGDPEDYMRGQRTVFLICLMMLMLIFFASLCASCRLLTLSTSVRESTDHCPESDSQLGTSGESLLHLLIDARSTNGNEVSKEEEEEEEEVDRGIAKADCKEVKGGGGDNSV